MRALSLVLSGLFLGSIFFVSYASGEPIERSTQGYVIAYYFHGAFRCPTCRKLEQYSKEAIEANFKDALASGKIIFKVVNVEEKGNEHFTKDYQLYTKSLVISLVKDAKEVKSKNLDKIWEYAGDKQRFYDYVKEEVAAFLKEL
ncbi:MAG: nitrophenyl compound nitroreductase subunit ArsF family protein [Candidatus Omnitrophica bacterium]|nr:nitrophenyl compound nitroreductase subunit ArsF family protein [Candidatus Omnitrophota bacterium]